MKMLVLLWLSVSSLAVLGQTDLRAEELAHIRQVYAALADTASNIRRDTLSAGLTIATAGDDSRRIRFAQKHGPVFSAYYSPVGLPLFVFVEAKTGNQRFYFDPLLADTPKSSELKRWIDERGEHRAVKGQAAQEQGRRILTRAYDLYHRVNGELTFTPEVYHAIIDRLGKRDSRLRERTLMARDTVDQLFRDQEAETDEEAGAWCWDDRINFVAEPNGPVVRTVEESGCDVGCMAYAVSTTTTEFDETGRILRTVEATTEYYLPEGSSVMARNDSAVTTYYDEGVATYAIVSAEQDGLTVFHELRILE